MLDFFGCIKDDEQGDRQSEEMTTPDTNRGGKAAQLGLSENGPVLQKVKGTKKKKKKTKVIGKSNDGMSPDLNSPNLP